MHCLSPKMSPNPLANTLNCHHQVLFLLLLSATYCSTKVLAEFTDAPIDLNVTEGEPLSLNCTFTGAERIFWRKDGEEITSENTNFRVTDFAVSAAATSMLSLSPSAEHTVHTGLYNCVAVMNSNEFATNFTITVQYLADVSISFRPFQCVEGNANPYIGSRVTIDCVAEGEPFPRVAWFFMSNKLRESDDPNINFQQNKRVLVISSLMSNHSGFYYCRSENDLFPAKLSQQIHLGFQTSVVSEKVAMITNAGPNDVIYAVENGPVTIDCVVSPPFPSVTNALIFQHSESNIISSGDYTILVKPCNSYSLIVKRIFHPTRTGPYTCTIGTQLGTDIASVQIGTVVPVKVTATLSTVGVPSPPGPSLNDVITIGVGRSVIFHCSRIRDPGDNDIPQVFNWTFQRQGSDHPALLVPTENRVAIVNDVTAITSTVTLQRVMLSDRGKFTCLTFNPAQQNIQANYSVTLIVEDSPSISVDPASSVVRIGAPLSLTCIMATTRNSTFSWFVNDRDVTEVSNGYSVSTVLPNQSTLTISNLDFRDLGQIRCTGKDPIHVPVHAVASVKETEESYIIGQGEAGMNVNATIQTNLILNCTVRNTNGEPLRRRWFLGNRQLNNAQEYSVDSSGTLIKNNVSLEDEAEYLCRAELGELVLEFSVNVMVTIPPTFTRTPPDSSEGVKGKHFKLTCEAFGKPTPMIFWSKTSQRVSELGDPLIRDPGNGSLIFEQLQSNHSGLYLCEILGARSMTSQTLLRVVNSEDDFMGVGVLNEDESILVFTVVGLVGILFIIASVMVIAVLVSCFYMRRPQGKYNIAKGDQQDGIFKRQASLRDNSGIHSSPSNHIFDTLQSPSSTTGYSSNPYSMGPATSMPLSTYHGPIPLTVGNAELIGGGARGVATNSMFSENINSHTSTPIHGTMASTSLFGSEEQTSVTTQLPNFPRANLQLGDVMGEGEFGPVVMGMAIGIVPNEERTLVAVKAIVPRGGGAGEEGEEEELNPEMALVDFANQMKLEFANIAMILGMCTDEEPYYVIYEYLNEGDLKKFLINSRPFDDDPPSLTPQHMQKIILQVADGMAYLFSQRIIHGDLATRNCLISSDLRVKIADLGIGHDLYNNDYYDNGSQLLPIRWMPPELLVNSDEGPTFSLHSDIWSFGVLCWEVFSYSRLPYDNYTDEDVLSMVPAGTRLRSPSKSCPPALYDIMMDCWHDIPEERPVFAKLCVAIIGCELD